MDGTAGQAGEDRLYGLMEVAERQQASVQAALEGLAAEREALARGVAGLQSGMQGALRSAVADSLAGAATGGVAAVQAATGPLLSRLAGVTQQAGQADAALRGVVAWASWRLLGWLVAAVAVFVLAGWLASGLALWWDMGAVAAARSEKWRLQSKRGLMPTVDGGGLAARPFWPREHPCSSRAGVR